MTRNVAHLPLRLPWPRLATLLLLSLACGLAIMLAGAVLLGQLAKVAL